MFVLPRAYRPAFFDASGLAKGIEITSDAAVLNGNPIPPGGVVSLLDGTAALDGVSFQPPPPRKLRARRRRPRSAISDSWEASPSSRRLSRTGGEYGPIGLGRRLGRVFKANGLARCPDGGSPEIISPVLASSGTIAGLFSLLGALLGAMRFACGLPCSSQAESRFVNGMSYQ